MGFREVTTEDERPLQEIADALAGSHKILIVTGAGISTSCGIPVRQIAIDHVEVLTVHRTSDPKMDCTT